METFNDDPNFSIVYPGGCNSRCAFCFNKDQPKIEPINIGAWLANLLTVLGQLGPKFYQISMTGGEPTISPYFDASMGIISVTKPKYTNILLTTNGTKLIEKLDIIKDVVDHINISRHHFDEKENASIFGNDYGIGDYVLSEIIDMYGRHGIDVSVNCVINDKTSKEFIDNYIQWAKSMGVYAIRFRKENGILAMTPVEDEYSDYKVIWEGHCPVCRTKLQRIKGMQVYWKSSTLEPTEKIRDKIFELIYEPNGLVYRDWNMKYPYTVPTPTTGKSRASSSSGGGRCGGSSSSCGGSSSRC